MHSILLSVLGGPVCELAKPPVSLKVPFYRASCIHASGFTDDSWNLHLYSEFLMHPNDHMLDIFKHFSSHGSWFLPTLRFHALPSNHLLQVIPTHP